MKKINIVDTMQVVGFLILVAICVLCSKGVLNPKSFSIQVTTLVILVAWGVSVLYAMVKTTLTQHYTRRIDKWVNYLGTATVVYYFAMSVTAQFLPDSIFYAELVVLCLLMAALFIIVIYGCLSDFVKRLRD